MKEGHYILSYDIGTTGNKTCLYRFDGTFRFIRGSLAEYPIRFTDTGGAEQDPEDWWKAMGRTTRDVLKGSGVSPERIEGISFCCQMQSLVLTDKKGTPVRPSMSYMDQRAGEQKRTELEQGIKIAGMNLFRLIPSLIVTGGVSASVKDPLWKYLWVKQNEPDVFKRVHRWLDVKEYLVNRCTGNFIMTPDSANATFLYDTRPGKGGWSGYLCGLFGVEKGHMPEVIPCNSEAGKLLPEAARELGLVAGISVFAGGGDVSLIALGSGAVGLYDTHVYMGTSGWVSSVADRRLVDTEAFIASINGAVPGLYNYISEQETSGKCMEWVKDHLALDEIGVYLNSKTIADGPEARYASLFTFLDSVIEEVPAGSEGVIFTPWLHGNRSPFEDSRARGIFFNIGLNTGKRALIRSVLEGNAYHCRWQLESIRKKHPARGPVRFVGGGAQSKAAGQILADVLAEDIEVPENPQSCGALGAAVLTASGLGLIEKTEDVKKIIPLNNSYRPRHEYDELHGSRFTVFKDLYRRNKTNFRTLNG